MTLLPARLTARLLEEGQKTVAFFQALTPLQMTQSLYTDGACWTVRQILAHFVAAELSITRLVESILSGGAGVPENFDLNGYNERKVEALQDVPIEALLQQFTAARQVSAALAARLSAADLQRTGRHPFLGVAPLGDMLQLLYRHNQIHQRDIRQALATQNLEPHG